MTKFTLKFLLIFSIFSGYCFANELILSVEKIVSLNSQMSIIYEQNRDKNSTDMQDFEILNSDKKDIISKLPALITSSTDFNQTALKSYITELERELIKYKPGSNHYISIELDRASKDLDLIFYMALSQISIAFRDYDKSPENAIIDAITKIQISNYQDLKTLKSNLNSHEFDLSFKQIEIKRYTYDEILNYLKDNAQLFASNFILTGLNLRQTISHINHYTNSRDYDLNFGKITMIAAVCIFFFLLPKLVSLIIFRIFLILLSRSRQVAVEFKEQFVAGIKTPINLFFVVYALELSLTIAYYPATISISLVNYFTIAYTIIIAWFMLGILDGYGIVLLSKIAQKSGRKEIINLIIKIMYFIVIIITILIILSKLGFDISTLIASLGIGGLAVALATKDIIANFFASILLLFDSSFSQGDWIVCGDVEGTVVEIGLRKTTIRTFDNALVFVPNSKIMSENIKNWNRRKVGRQIKMHVGLSYTTSKQSIQNCINDIKEMLLNHPGIAKSGIDSALNNQDARIKYRQSIVSMDDLNGYKNNLFVVLDEFGDSSINILIYCFSKSVVWGEFLATKEDVMLKIMEIVEKYDDASFAFPSQSLYIESMPKIQIYKGESDVK
ncbi:mechanosensitive ion channel family protein [Campylobacter vicugnae]|uniref:mechanosensitive ion channel family protein n=1 Tax=Campylobacter vicugnae TaxID=1660076 RepID=UPI000A2FB53A|nr:mechanosensitive ion channel family protein [Campylobacter sp. RM12175]ARR04526.1 mechanosensitive ion channel family protein [Campylobacter sp. RM12175]